MEIALVPFEIKPERSWCSRAPVRHKSAAPLFLLRILPELRLTRRRSSDVPRRFRRENVKKLLLIAIFVLSSSLFAQSNRGTVTGTVSDSTGALIPGVEVVLTNTETGAKSDTVTTGTGNYTLLQLPVGTYTLTVEKTGFARYERTGIQVQVAVTTRVDVVLTI